MKSRLAALVATTIAVALGVSSCSSVSNDAATVDGTSLSMSEFEERTESMSTLDPSFLALSGNVSADLGRDLLSVWVMRQLAPDVLASVDESITAEDIASTQEQVDRDPALSQADEETKTWLVDVLSAQTAFNRTVSTDDEKRLPILAAIGEADIRIASQFGTWDPVTLSVVELGAQQPAVSTAE